MLATQSTVNYNIDSPKEDQLITELNFHFQCWITLDDAIETVFFLSDGKTNIKLFPTERKDVEQAFPDKYVIGLSQTISTIDLLSNAHYFIKFQGPEKEHRILVPMKIKTDKAFFLEAKKNKREKVSKILQCPVSDDTSYIFEDNKVKFTNSKQEYYSNNKYINFLNLELKEVANIHSPSKSISANNYDPIVRSLIDEYQDGLLLDIGSGFRNNYYENVVFLDIQDYPTTDILSIAERLPFQDNSFDAIICISVLQHIKTPSKAASEIVRVLKPGGKILATASFMAPYQADPGHYFNFTPDGLKALFPSISFIESGLLPSMHPIVAITNILNNYTHEIEDPRVKNDFLNMKVQDLIGDPMKHLGTEYHASFAQSEVTKLSSASYFIAKK